jgi:YTH domain-containing family protein
VKLPKAFDTEKKMLNEELGLQKLSEVEGVLNNDPSLEKAEQKSDVNKNGVALGDIRSPTEKLAGANGC